MEALWVAACPDEANKFFAFLAGAAASQLQRGTDLQIMFGIGGEHDLTERELPHLAGWRGSRPVRVGNGAWNQRQLDVYGELLGAASAWSTSWASWMSRPAASWSLQPTPRRFVGPRRIRGSGRSAASPASSCTPS
jgi:GH15 family glucan-1,4-alpha-glucosidase